MTHPTMHQPHGITFVIVTWNSADVLGRCLASVRTAAQHSEGLPEWEAIVVDNDSRDTSLSVAEQHGATVVRNAANVGFAFAVNQGAAQARHSWLMLLNPDARLAPGFFRVFSDIAPALNPKVASIIPDILFEGVPLRQSRGLALNRFGYLSEVGAGEIRRDGVGTQPVFGGPGGALLIRRDAFLSVGGLSPHFFAYFEDADLAFRLRAAGKDAIYEPRLQVQHVGATSTGHQSPVKLYLVARGRALYGRAHLMTSPISATRALLYSVGAAAIGAMAERSAAPLRGCIAGLRRGRATSASQVALQRFSAATLVAQWAPKTTVARLVRDRLRSRRLYAESSRRFASRSAARGRP